MARNAGQVDLLVVDRPAERDVQQVEGAIAGAQGRYPTDRKQIAGQEQARPKSVQTKPGAIFAATFDTA